MLYGICQLKRYDGPLCIFLVINFIFIESIYNEFNPSFFIKCINILNLVRFTLLFGDYSFDINNKCYLIFCLFYVYNNSFKVIIEACETRVIIKKDFVSLFKPPALPYYSFSIWICILEITVYII